MGTALALADPSYSAPALAYSGELAESEDVVWWIVVVGFAYAVALAYVRLVPPQGRRRRDLVRLDGVQGCLSQPLAR